MKKNILRSSLAIFLCSSFFLSSMPLTTTAQTAEEIISKHIEAMGGREKLASLQTVYLEGVSVMQNGTEINSKNWRVKDKLFRQEISFGMGEIVVIVTPGKAWRSNPRNGGNFEALPEEQVKEMQLQLDPVPLLDYAAKGSTAELIGQDTVNGSPAYKIRLTTRSGLVVLYLIDLKTGYVIREIRKGGGMMGGNRRGGAAGGNGGVAGNAPNSPDTYNIDFSDYQKTPEGFILPFTVAIGGGPRTSFEKIEINKPVDEAKLSKPGN